MEINNDGKTNGSTETWPNLDKKGKVNRPVARMSTSKNGLNMILSEMRKRRQLIMERYKRSRGGQAIEKIGKSQLVLNQNREYIQRIADRVEKVLPGIKKDFYIEPKNVTCFICSKALSSHFWTAHILGKHFYRCFKCTFCGDSFGYLTNLERHIKMNHSKDEQEKLILTTLLHRESEVKPSENDTDVGEGC